MKKTEVEINKLVYLDFLIVSLTELGMYEL